MIVEEGHASDGIWLIVGGSVAITGKDHVKDHHDVGGNHGKQESTVAKSETAPKVEEGQEGEGVKEDADVVVAVAGVEDEAVHAMLSTPSMAILNIDGTLVQGGAVLGEIEAMAKDAGMNSQWRNTCMSVTKVRSLFLADDALAVCWFIA